MQFINQKYLLFFFALLFGSGLLAQVEGYDLEFEEDSIRSMFQMIYTLEDDQERLKINERLVEVIEDVLLDEASFEYPFDSVPMLGILNSPDGKLRIYNWNILLSDKTNIYFGFLQYYHEKKDEYLIYRLDDHSETLPNPEKKTLSHNNWYGALYYRLIEKQHDDVVYYTLLGWDGNDHLTTKKVIDVLTFTSSGKPKFGNSMFEIFYERAPGVKRKKKVKRILFEYSARAGMWLDYNENEELIVFDHLSPFEYRFKGNYQFYGPDMSQDALRFKRGTWFHKEDVDIRRERDKSKEKPKEWKYDPYEDFMDF